ncbi:MAG: arylsulfotransferase family protein [Thermodesulfobacteriota bacterium]
MKQVSIFSGIFLLAVSLFAWGYFSAEYKFFPWSIINPVQKYIQGTGVHSKKVTDKIMHDLGLRPERMLKDLELNKNRDYKTVAIDGLRERRSKPVMFSRREHLFSSGYLLIWGAFDFENNLYGAILVDKYGQVVHRWIPDYDSITATADSYNANRDADDYKHTYQNPISLPQGIAIYPEGSLIYNDGDPSNGMQKMDFCSQPMWTKLGRFSHEIVLQEDGSRVWTIDDDRCLHQIDAQSGESLHKIEVGDIMEANPDVDILSIRRDDFTDDRWLPDFWHFNDVEPLPLELAGDYLDFQPGDLLVSSRSLNAVMVIDPYTKKIKWWRVGAFSRQHDPDWQAGRKITIYDNQTREVLAKHQPENPKKYSRIIELDMDTYQTDVLYDGIQDNFYSGIRGKHQFLPNGDLLITSSTQGRIMIVNDQGETVFEFFNRYNEDRVLLLSEAVWIGEDFFDFDVERKECGHNDG